MTTATKKWSELTKEERAARIKEGQKAAAERRAQASDSNSDIDTLVAQKVAAAIAVVKATNAITGAKDPNTMTKDELKAEHDRLQAALEALPFVGDEVKGLQPGTVLNAGQPNAEYVPFTHAWFEDVEERRKDRNIHNGRPQECEHDGKPHGTTPGLCGLKWPNYDVHTVVYMGTKPETVGINGVYYGMLPGLPCKLPEPHYGLYLQSLHDLRRHGEQFMPPTPSTNPGYMHVNISNSSGRPVAVLLGKGPLASMEEREANDRPVTQ